MARDAFDIRPRARWWARLAVAGMIVVVASVVLLEVWLDTPKNAALLDFPPRLLYLVVMVLVLAGSVTYAIVVQRRLRAARRVADANHRVLAEWAARRSWAIGDVGDVERVARAQSVMDKAGVLRPKDWDIASVIEHERPDGRFLVACGVSESGQLESFAALSSEVVLDRLRATLRKGTIEVAPEPKRVSGVALGAALEGLPDEAVLSLEFGELVLRCHGLATPELVEDLVARLTRLSAACPAEPSAGPVR